MEHHLESIPFKNHSTLDGKECVTVDELQTSIETKEWSWFRAQSKYKDFHQVRWSQEEGTNAEEFCEACETLLRLAEHLVPMFAGFCTNDLATELKKIRSRTMEEKVSTLEQIISVERTQAKKTATHAIDWMLLVLNFGAEAYQANLRSEAKEELSVSFTKAWDREYYKHFNFLVRPLFRVLIKAAPSRRNFYPKLGSPTELVEKDFGNWLNGIEIVSGRIEEWKNKENRSDDQ